MNFTKAGIILNTENYEDCVHFYGGTLGLPLLHQIDRPGEKLTTYALGETYLMIETEGTSCTGTKPVDICPAKFRFNVPDVEATSDALRRKGVDIEVNHYSWGVTAEFSDPDGNRCALRSDEGFGF
ncbi:MAG: VOC family protein [Pseudomonadota bacterium]